MKTDDLRAAYDRFLDAAREPGFSPAPDGEWSADLVLAHVIVGDRLIAEATAAVLAGRKPQFDNRASQSEPYLRAVVEAAGDWDGLVEGVRRGARELVAVAERTSDEQAATEISVYIVSGDEVVVDGPRPLAFLLQGPAAVHLPIHIGQLAALRAG